MIKNDSFQKNILFKKLEANEIRRMNRKKKNNNYKISDYLDKNNNNIKEHIKNKNKKNHLNLISNNIKIKSNFISFSKSSNNFSHKNKEKPTINDNKKIINEYESSNINLNINSYTNKNNENSKNKNRYLTCFDNSISSKYDENRINTLLNDFTITNEAKNKENVNINKEKNKNRNTKLIIKVNKKNYIQPKNFYLKAFNKLKEKHKNGNEENIRQGNDLRNNYILKIPINNKDRKRNITQLIKSKHYKKSFSCLEENISSNKNDCLSTNHIKKYTNSFRLSQRKLFLKNNNLKKYKKNGIILKRINTENDKIRNQSCFRCDGRRKINKNLSTDINSIMDYEQRKIKVQRYQSPNHEVMYNIKLKNANLTIDQNTSVKNDIQNIATIKSPKNEDVFKTLSFTNNNKNTNLNERNFSLDFSLNNNRNNDENDKMTNLLSPISSRKYSKNKVSSLSKKRYLRKMSKKNVKETEFDFEELNKKLFKMIKNLENADVIVKEKKNNKKNEEGFIKWDVFEKIITEDN